MNKKLMCLLLTVIMISLFGSSALAATATFDVNGEHYSNEWWGSTKCYKSTDGDRKYYVTITSEMWGSTDDTVYFGPRKVLTRNASGDPLTVSGALSDGLGYTYGRKKAQSAYYFSSATGLSGQQFVLNIKQATAGSGSYFSLAGRWTP